MSGDEWAVLAVIVAMVGALASRRVSPTTGVVAALLTLFVTGVVDPTTAFTGFSNPAPIAVAALYVVAGGLQRTGALGAAIVRLGAARRFASMAAGAAVVSAVVANTPVVAILVDPVIRWARDQGRSPSKFLIPLSYATILGGMTTLIGTSTNLAGSGVLEQLGQAPLGFFEPARFGVPVAVLGLLAVSALGPRLLPGRGGSGVGDDGSLRDFTVSCEVVGGGPLDGRSVAAAGLRDLSGVFLVAVQRAGSPDWITPVTPDLILRGGDRCNFAGAVDEIVDLQNRPGLRFAESDQLDRLDDGQHAWFEAVVGPGSALVGRTLKQAQFRDRYQAAVVALHRAGRPLPGKLGAVRLRLGDSLLLVSDLGFGRRWNRRSDFLLVRRRSEPPPTASARSGVALALLGVVVLLSVFQVTDVLRAAVIGAVLTVLTGVLTPRQARDAIDLNVVVLIASAIGLGAAATETGLADRLARSLTDLFDGLGTWGVAIGITVTALVLTEIVTNAGAVAITVPIAVAAAAEIGADPRRFALGAIVAASASFLSPIGYQTNTMVYGPGRYRMTDYLRVGVPLTLIVLIVVPAMMVGGTLW